MSRIKLQCLAFAGLAGFSQVAAAHTGVTVSYDLIHGFRHVLFGLDHCLAMLGLGLWASSQHGLLAKRCGLIFGLFMAAGALSGWMGFAFAYLETAVPVSLLTVGIALGLGADKCPKSMVLTSIAVFAAIHGLTHGHEMPAYASVYGYVIGIVLASMSLYLGGWAMGRLARRENLNGLIRLYGTMAGITGAWLLFAW